MARLCLHISRSYPRPMQVPLGIKVTLRRSAKSMALIFFKWPHLFLSQGPKGPSEKNPRMNTGLATVAIPAGVAKFSDALELKY